MGIFITLLFFIITDKDFSERVFPSSLPKVSSEGGNFIANKVRYLEDSLSLIEDKTFREYFIFYTLRFALCVKHFKKVYYKQSL